MNLYATARALSKGNTNELWLHCGHDFIGDFSGQSFSKHCAITKLPQIEF
jgi:hypothetical protein